MNIVLFSSVFNHHSMPLCDELYRLCDGNFWFVATEKEEQQRKDLGYHSYERPYVINMLQSEEEWQKAYQLALSADVMIAGVFPYEFLKARLQNNKLTFLCQERMFKGGVTSIRRLRAWAFNVRRFLRFQNKPLYFLSIGKGAARDYHSIGFYRNKRFSWAYFPPFVSYDMDELQAKKHRSPIELLFVGRMISWKHPEYPLRAIKELIEQGYNIHLSYVGTGEMEPQLRQLAQSISQHVSFLGAMPPEQVRRHMEEANIFAFTSNSMEGWGVVANEAMNSGCAVIASNSAGASTVLIRDGENGLLFPGDDYAAFYEKLEYLVKNPEQINTLGRAAYRTIAENYTAAIAAQRFYDTCQALLSGEDPADYADGVMRHI